MLLSIQSPLDEIGRWKIKRGQFVSVCDSFSGQTEYSVEEIIVVTEKMFLLRAKDGILIHCIRNQALSDWREDNEN
jgi:hypothetical protein